MKDFFKLLFGSGDQWVVSNIESNHKIRYFGLFEIIIVVLCVNTYQRFGVIPCDNLK